MSSIDFVSNRSEVGPDFSTGLDKNCTIGEVLIARIIGVSRNAALRDGVVVTKSRIPRGEPRMATRKGSSKRPQRQHKQSKKSWHDRRVRLKRRNTSCRKTAEAKV